MTVGVQSLSPHKHKRWITFTSPREPGRYFVENIGPAFVSKIPAAQNLRHAAVYTTLDPYESIAGDLVSEEDAAVRLPTGWDELHLGVPFLVVNGERYDFQHLSQISWYNSTYAEIKYRVQAEHCWFDLIIRGGAKQPYFEWFLLMDQHDTNYSINHVNLDSVDLCVDDKSVISSYWAIPNQVESLSHSKLRLFQSDYVGVGQRLAWQGIYSIDWNSYSHEEVLSIMGAFFGPVRAWDNEVSEHISPTLQAPQLADKEGKGVAGAIQRGARWLKKLHEPRDRWAPAELGMLPSTGSTGSQEDFGWTHAEWISPVEPRFAAGVLDWHLYESYLEARRPNGWREPDGSRLVPENHPDLAFWNGVPHWHNGVSPDQLGQAPNQGPQTHGFFGPDREHWSNRLLTSIAQISGDPILQEIVRDQIAVYLAAQTIDPKFTTSHAGAARGIGRVLESACWLYRACSDPVMRTRLSKRLSDRITKIILPETMRSYEVKAISVHPPDGRNLQGRVPFWMPWQDMMASHGMAVCAYMLHDNDLMKRAEELAINCARYGMWELGNRIVIGKAVTWKENGTPLDPSQYEQDGEQHAVDSSNGIYNVWATPAAQLFKDKHPNLKRLYEQTKAGRESGPVGKDPLAKWIFPEHPEPIVIPEETDEE